MRHQILLFITTIAFLGGSSGPGAALPQSGTAEYSKASMKIGPANDSSSSVLRPVTILPSQVQVVQDAGQTVIQVSSKRPLHYRSVRTDNPRCLVVDIENAMFPTAPKSYSGNSTLISEVRVAERSDDTGSVVRVVAELEGNPKFEIESVATGLRILLNSRSAVRPKDSTARKSLTPALTTANLRPRPSQSSDHFAGLRADASAVPAGTPEVRKAEEAAKTLASKIGNDAGGVLPAGAASAPHALEPAPSEYSGEKISVNLKDVDLKDFFRLIHEVSGLNIVVDPDVAGSVTLVLDDVPWDQALEIVLKNNGLGKTLEGNVLRIAKISTLTAEQEGAAKLAEARSDATPLVTVFRSLKYAHAEDRQVGSNSGISQQGPQTVPISGIATLVQKLPGVLSKRGSVMADVRDNAVIVTDAASQIPIIDGVIAKLDNKTKQVSIQARIVQASSNFTKTLSSALAGGLTNPSGSTKGGGASGSPGVSAASPTPAGSSSSSSVWTPNNISGIANTASTIIPGIASGFGVLAITNASKNYFINAAIGAAEQRQQAKTISAPSLVTQDNMPGEVIQGAQIPIQTTINNTISVQYINASLQFDVTPQVTGDGSIFLTIKVINATPGAVIGTSGNPQINTQQVTTQVLVPDGGTVVFGGVKVTSRTRSNNQVPGIGNVPILGDLFKAKDDEDHDQELLFFVTPQVVS